MRSKLGVNKYLGRYIQVDDYTYLLSTYVVKSYIFSNNVFQDL